MQNSCGIIDTLRQPKIFNISVFDLSGTILIAVLLTWWLSTKNKMKFNLANSCMMVVLFIVVAIITHKLIGKPTMLNYYLGLNSLEAVMANRKVC
jgi:hypothetical protein